MMSTEDLYKDSDIMVVVIGGELVFVYFVTDVSDV